MKRFRVIFRVGADFDTYAFSPTDAAILGAADRIGEGQDRSILVVKNMDTGEEYAGTVVFVIKKTHGRS